MRRSQVDVSFEELGRATKFSRLRPLPPRGLQYNATTGVLSWEKPAITSNVTHYRVYAGSELNLVREVPSGQLQISDNLQTSLVFVTAFNKPGGIESAPAHFSGVVSPPGGGGGGTGAIQFIYTETLIVASTTINEPAFDDNSLVVSSAVLGDRLDIWLKQDGSGNRKAVWGAAFKARGANLITTPDAYTVFGFVKKDTGNPIWWQVYGGIGYA